MSLPTVDAMRLRGCPYVDPAGGGGKQWRFDTAAVFAWGREEAAASSRSSKDDLAAARLLEAEARADLRVMERDARRGELVEVETVIELVGERWSTLRSRLRQLPTSVAHELGNLVERHLLELGVQVDDLALDTLSFGVLEDAVDEALAELSGAEDVADESVERITSGE